MQRVLVLGCSGAGKSTVSDSLAAITGLPLIGLDRVFWRPGWEPTPSQEWQRTVAALCEGPCWIMDGNYSGTLPIRLARADTVIWLDYPRHICLRRALTRIAKGYGRVREGMAEGCRERFDLEFLRYIWNFNARSRPRIAGALASHGSYARLHCLQADEDAERLLRELSLQRAQIPDSATC
jgi:adenylate kinase family enzyme